VGEVTYEVNLVTKGQHYGWPYREGAFGYPVTTCATPGQRERVELRRAEVLLPARQQSPAGIDGDCQSITGGVFSTAPPGRRHSGGSTSSATTPRESVDPDASANRDGFVSGSRTPFGTGFGTPVRFIVGRMATLRRERKRQHHHRHPAEKCIRWGLPDGGAPDAGAPDGGARQRILGERRMRGTSTGERRAALAMQLALLAVVGRGRRGAPGR
jgi:hypothetical protein